eukprot:gene1661-2305_t
MDDDAAEPFSTRAKPRVARIDVNGRCGACDILEYKVSDAQRELTRIRELLERREGRAFACWSLQRKFQDPGMRVAFFVDADPRDVIANPHRNLPEIDHAIYMVAFYSANDDRVGRFELDLPHIEHRIFLRRALCTFAVLYQRRYYNRVLRSCYSRLLRTYDFQPAKNIYHLNSCLNQAKYCGIITRDSRNSSTPISFRYSGTCAHENEGDVAREVDGEVITRIREFLEVMGKHAVFFRACLKEVSARWFGALAEFYCFVDIAREIVTELPFETHIRGETTSFLAL